MAEFPDPIESTATPRQVLSVSALNRRARQLLETHLPLLWVEGELTNFSCPASGHWYFTLKDEHAQVRAAMFRTRNRLLNLRPVSGQQVLVRGRIGLYEPRGDYQLIVDHMEPAGQGLLQRRFDELKARLAAEGLFDIARKRALPTLPRGLGVVTSPTGAAIQDVLRVLRRRFPALPVFIYPTPVQGSEAAAGIVAALDFANRHGACDLLILTRGGGSLEDLWPFNEEAVARAVAASAIPVICGVGHETDVTIADFAADLRAPTPSAAAELASPDQNELLAALAGYQRRLERGMATLMLRFGTHLEALRRRLRHPRERLERQAQHLDHLEIRLVSAIRARLATDTARLHRLDVRRERHDPRQRLVQTRMRLAQLDAGLTQHMRQLLARAREQLEARAAVLHAVSPLNTLERGYAIVLDRSGRNVGQVTATRVGAELGVRLRDGRLDCTVTGIDTRDTLAIARDFTSGASPPQD
ncbi:MAG: exodeoxyribonuclease VII large subunit [Gammaproteobacteria bacterium]|nr:exodeoxyribonuclease VII large subunit [Gammaproteobacteria bacterium]